MRMRGAAIPAILGLIAISTPCFADSVTVTSGADGTVIVNGKPCRVVNRDENDPKQKQGSNSTSITSGAGGLGGTTTVSPGGGGASSSVTVGSGSSSGTGSSSAAAGSDCVIYKDKDR